jgi:uncharacterized membrane protein YczE
LPRILSSKSLPSVNIALKFWTRRLVVYLAGLFLLALGVALSIKSDLGVSPINTVPYVLSRVTAIEVGLMTAMVNTSYVLIQFALLGKEMRPRDILQVISGVTFGIFVTAANYLLAFVVPAVPASYWLRLGLLAISILCFSVGTLLYLTADVIPKPSEGIMLAIQKRSGWELSRIKTGVDCSLVTISFLISMVFSGKVLGIGVGTLVTALSVGSVLGALKKLFYSRASEFCFGKAS